MKNVFKWLVEKFTTKKLIVTKESLSDSQVNRGLLFYSKHKNEINKSVNDIIGVPIIGALRNTPVRWQPSHWKWFLNRYV